MWGTGVCVATSFVHPPVALQAPNLLTCVSSVASFSARPSISLFSCATITGLKMHSCAARLWPAGQRTGSTHSWQHPANGTAPLLSVQPALLGNQQA